MVNLSRLEEIKDLRTVWPHEALDLLRGFHRTITLLSLLMQ